MLNLQAARQLCLVSRQNLGNRPASTTRCLGPHGVSEAVHATYKPPHRASNSAHLSCRGRGTQDRLEGLGLDETGLGTRARRCAAPRVTTLILVPLHLQELEA